MKLLVSAAESSADIHGAELVHALKKILPAGEKLQVFGIGGPRLRAEGLEAAVRTEDLSVMGASEVLHKLPRILKSLRQISQAAEKRKPDLAIVLDSPDFHFRLAKKLKKLKIPAVYYIPPKIWVWRKGRIHFLKKHFIQILSILPFEQDYYQNQSIPFQFVGNPLVDELPWGLSKDVARSQLGLGAQDRVLVVMPGSRLSELDAHFALMIEAAREVAMRLCEQGQLMANESLKVLVALPSGLDQDRFKAELNQLRAQHVQTSVEFQLSFGDAHRCMIAADVGLIKSGTSTLEAGLLQCPHVITYRPSAVTGWIFKNLVRHHGPVGLVNWVAGWKLGQSWPVPELLCENAEPRLLAAEVCALFVDQGRRHQMLEALGALRKSMGVSSSGELPPSPSLRAAQEVIRLCRKRGILC